VIDERLLYVVKFAFSRYTFDRRYAASARLCNWNQTTIHNPTIKHHGTRATLTFATAFLCSGELKFFT